MCFWLENIEKLQQEGAGENKQNTNIIALKLHCYAAVVFMDQQLSFNSN